MTTTTTNPYPNIAPPAGAETLCDWADGDNEYRFITNTRGVDGTKVVLSPCATQLSHGSIDTAGVVSEAPSVMTYEVVDGRPGRMPAASASRRPGRSHSRSSRLLTRSTT